MLDKLFNVRKLSPSARGVSAKPAASGLAKPEASSSVLKIVHVGGHVECYYMAVPAVRIIEKYPSFILARPEVFMRPWDSVVGPDEILTPGEKFLLVPRGTMKKLWRRIRKPDREVSINSFASKTCSDFTFQQNEVSVSREVSPCASFKSAFRKKSAIRKQVRFVGIDVKHRADGSYTERKNNTAVEEKPKKPEKGFNSHTLAGKKRGAKIASSTWQPSLKSITEKTVE
ncbi:hypothetical protein ACOSQ2_002969 [Xanthoceras sorbifolium]|uniref:Uncharacterized protein n=1 Tax=Xanthoceras sorbifolium TaxID=99658 RepID=A0ABQ8IK96_9ROSI|nr:hypothetical protein JRO89_XS01G0115300 [Xanthoceras sorbifolium]